MSPCRLASLACRQKQDGALHVHNTSVPQSVNYPPLSPGPRVRRAPRGARRFCQACDRRRGGRKDARVRDEAVDVDVTLLHGDVRACFVDDASVREAQHEAQRLVRVRASRIDVLIHTTGFSEIDRDWSSPIIQSNTFLNEPGSTPTYSGVETSSASAP